MKRRNEDNMGVKIGTDNSRVIELKDRNGTVVGSIRISNPTKKKLKHAQYSFRELSDLIIRSKTSNGAYHVVTMARAKIAVLQKKLKTGEYNDKELESAIIHAKKMERIARKKAKHLKEEERAKNQGFCLTESEEMEASDLEEEKEEVVELSKEELEKLMQEFQELMKESMKEEMGVSDLADEFMGVEIQKDMTPQDLERLKKKHRSDEMKEITEANMKYLKALFQEMEKEKQSSSNAVSLQLSGTEMPVQVTETPVMIEGGNFDVSL